MDELKQLIREVPDFPKPGINFYDITTLLKHPDGLRKTVDALAAAVDGEKIDTVVGVEARGFIFAPIWRRLQSKSLFTSLVGTHCRMLSELVAA